MPADARGDIRNAHDARVARALARVNTCAPGRIEKYDPKLREAEVKACIRFPRRDTDTDELEQQEYKNVVAVPVVFPGNRNGGFAWRPDLEDTGLLLYCQQPLEDWLISGGIVDGREGQRFGITDAIFIPGLHDFGGDPWPEPDEGTFVVWVKDGPSVVVRRELRNDQGVVTQQAGVEIGGADARPAKAEPLQAYLTSLVSWIGGFTAPSGGGPLVPPGPAPSIPELGSSAVKVGA